MAAVWYVQVGSRVQGPLDGVKLKALAASGEVVPSTPVGKSSRGPWIPAGSIHGLFPRGFGVATVGRGTATAPPAVQSSADPTSDDGSAFVVVDTSGPTSAPRESRRPVPAMARLKVVWGAVASGLGVMVFVGSLIYNFVWLPSDAAAISLIKESMQETFSGDQTITEPVEVIEVGLKGKGTKRTGTAVVRLGDTVHEVPFTATVTNSIAGLEVRWQTQSAPEASTLDASGSR